MREFWDIENCEEAVHSIQRTEESGGRKSIGSIQLRGHSFPTKITSKLHLCYGGIDYEIFTLSNIY